ncbi:hypothetical protein [Sorangium sp. So ce1335]|uniref:hypothetical protein n=1 Tax=Sorangium sp. So ce1335 TaxID=3133335 RepID=UPI003F648DE0
MNVAEKVATLEALLQRVQRNAAAPRTRTQLPVSAELVPHRGEAPGAIANDIAGAASPDGGLSSAEMSPASEARPAAASPAAASAVAMGGSPRAAEPVLDDARQVAASPAQTGAASAAKQPAAAARAPQEAQPAARAPQPAAAAKTPQQPPVKTPAATTPAAAAARTPAARTAAGTPARSPMPSGGAFDKPAAGRPAASLDLPRAEARDAGSPVGGQETYRPPAEPAEPRPREAARTAASKVTAPVAARSTGPAVPPARGSSPRAEGKPFFPHEDVAARAKPAESDSELSFAGLLPDEPEPAKAPALKLPAERRPMPEPAAAVAARAATTPLGKEGASEAAAPPEAAVSEPVTPKAVADSLAASTRRAMGEPAVERELSREMVDDEPTVIRGMLEDEPTVIRSRPEGLEDEETAVRSARSEAQAIARSVQDQETVDAGPGALPREAAEEAERKSRPKPIDRDQLPKVITKDPPIAPVEKGPKPSEVATTRPPADTSVTERPTAPRRSRAGLVIAAVALLVAGAAVAHRLGLFGSEPAPPTNVVPDNTAGAAQDVTAQPPATAPTPAAATAETAPAEAAPAAPSAAETTTPAATAAPAETAAPAATGAAAAGSAENLPSNRGHLLVNSPEQASVYVNGSLAGNTGETLEVPCGTRYVRLGKLTTEKAATPAWLSAGQAVIVGCRKQTVVSINPTPASPAPERPAKRKGSPAAAPSDQEGAAPAPAGGDAPAPADDPAP